MSTPRASLCTDALVHMLSVAPFRAASFEVCVSLPDMTRLSPSKGSPECSLRNACRFFLQLKNKSWCIPRSVHTPVREQHWNTLKKLKYYVCKTHQPEVITFVQTVASTTQEEVGCV